MKARVYNRREGEYPTLVYPSVVSLDQAFIMVWFVQCKPRLYKHTIIKVMYVPEQGLLALTGVYCME